MRGYLSVGLVTSLATLSWGPVSAPPGHDVPTAVVAGPGVVLSVTGKVPKPLKLDAAAFARLPRQAVRARDHAGKDVEFEGVALVELLKAAGLNLTPDELRGPALEYYLVVEAVDGYRVVFALPELAPAFTDRLVLLADRSGGKPLGANEGPFRVVVPGEKRHARWVRQVVSLKVGRD